MEQQTKKELLNYFRDDSTLEAGIDEAGAGCLAGPLVVSSVIWNPNIDDEFSKMLNDSKKISEKKREMLTEYIEANAIGTSTIFINPDRIDEINIRNARIEGFHMAVKELPLEPELILVDGNMMTEHFDKHKKEIEYETIEGGDAKYKSIAAASILAKTYRDRYMLKLAEEFPQYCWENNKGYGTQKHMDALREFGTTQHHRMSYAPCRENRRC